MPIEKMSHAEYLQQVRDNLKTALNQVLSEEAGAVELSVKILEMVRALKLDRGTEYQSLVSIESQVDHLPNEELRKIASQKYKVEIERETAELNQFFSEDMNRICRALLEKISAESE